MSMVQTTAKVEMTVHEIPAILEDGEAVQVGFPVRLADDSDGPNWTIEHVANGRAYLTDIRQVIADVQQRCELKA
jgi:hypothetical protein